MGKKHSHSQTDPATKRPVGGADDDLLASLRALRAEILARRVSRSVQ